MFAESFADLRGLQGELSSGDKEDGLDIIL